MTLTEMFNICNFCVYCPTLCGGDPEVCVTKYSGLVLPSEREEEDHEHLCQNENRSHAGKLHGV